MAKVKAKSCVACGIDFDEDGNEMGKKLNKNACKDGHSGPFPVANTQGISHPHP